MSTHLFTSRRLLVLVSVALVALLAWSATRSGSEAAPAPARAGAAQAGKVVFDALPGQVKATLPIRSVRAGGESATTGGGSGTGKFAADDLALVLDAADVDPLLLRASVTGLHVQKVTVTVFRAGSNDRQQVWELGDVIIGEVRTSQTGSAKPAQVSLGLRYGKATLTSYDAKGAVAQSFCFTTVGIEC